MAGGKPHGSNPRNRNEVRAKQAAFDRAERQATKRGIGCANCGKPPGMHCHVHVIPCCPGTCKGPAGRAG